MFSAFEDFSALCVCFCASDVDVTVLIILVSRINLYLVYGVGVLDLGERLEARKKWRQRWEKLTGKRKE